MSLPRFRRFSAVCALVSLGAGCSHLDVAPGGDPNRTLTGVVQHGAALPAGTEVSVRLIATTANEPVRGAGVHDLPVVPRASAAMAAERVLGAHTQVLAHGTTEAVPFGIEYHADDAVVRHGLTVDVRVSFGGRLRYRTISAHVVTLTSSRYRQEVPVQPVDR